MFRIIKAKGKKEAMGYATYGEFAFGFYNEVVVHLPFVSSVHNLWRAKQLFHLNYGFSNFRQGLYSSSKPLKGYSVPRVSYFLDALASLAFKFSVGK